MPDSASMSPWKRFWEKGGWWKAVILAAVYYGLYQALGFVALPFAGHVTEGTAAYVLAFVALPIFLGCLVLVGFGLSLGWLRELFGRQPIRGGWWMWIAVAVVAGFNLLRFSSIDYDAAGFDYVAAWLLTGLFIGFAEEVLTRGYVVNLMRKAGHSEIAVALVSAAVFAGLHAGNLLGGQDFVTTLVQVAYTFAFGLCMYLALRVTGNIIWPILLHATTDPSIFLLTEYPAAGSLAPLASLGNILVIITALVLTFFIRGRVAAREGDPALVAQAPLA